MTVDNDYKHKTQSPNAITSTHLRTPANNCLIFLAWLDRVYHCPNESQLHIQPYDCFFFFLLTHVVNWRSINWYVVVQQKLKSDSDADGLHRITAMTIAGVGGDIEWTVVDGCDVQVNTDRMHVKSIT